MDKKIKKQRQEIKSLIERAEKLNIDYIQCYDNIFSSAECKKLIKKFNKFDLNKKTRPGKVGKNKLNLSFKESRDIDLYKDAGKDYNDEDIDDMYISIHNKIGVCVYSYLMNVGVLGRHFIGVSMYNAKSIVPEDLIPEMPEYFIIQKMQLRKYKKNKGGYYMLHYDASGSLDRILAVIIYLNETKYGGETSFPILKREIEPKVGRVAIFPSYFTHLHYGKTSSSDKYVICSHIVDDRITFKEKQERKEQ